MTKRKSTVVPGTATIAAAPAPSVINEDRVPNPKDPHSQLELVGDPPGTRGLRVMWGCLRARYRDYRPTASAFVAAKLRTSWSDDPNAATAAWIETLAPADADDSFADAMLLSARIDQEIGRDAEGKTPLLGYATITDPETTRLHVFRDELRGVARALVETYGGPVIAIVHAPGRVGNANPVHAHLCLSPYVVDGSLGFSTRIAPFTGDKGRQIILDAWRNRRRFI